MKNYIRPVLAEDFVNWLTLWKGYQEFYNTRINEKTTQTTFERFIDKNEPIFCLVIENQEKQLTGLVHYIFHRSTWTEENYCYLQDLFVEPAFRLKGFGKSLIEAVYEQAGQNNCSRVYWLTQENNEQARRLYDQIADNTGFIQYRKLLK